MAPDRGITASTNHQNRSYDSISNKTPPSPDNASQDSNTPVDHSIERARRRSDARRFLAERAAEGQNFTLRGVLVGLAIGVVICFSNTYFGLQTGWVSGMSMPSALIGFAFFKSIARYLKLPFTPVENVLVQTVAQAVGTMPLGCGFVGVIPALNFLLKPEENGPLSLPMWKLIIWSLGICLFGVVFAVPLRKEVIIREKLKFPSGTATALMIGVLHGSEKETDIMRIQSGRRSLQEDEQNRNRALIGSTAAGVSGYDDAVGGSGDMEDIPSNEGLGLDDRDDWKSNIRLMIIAFSISSFYTLFSYFIPQLHDIPILGLPLARKWLWTLNPSPAYVGQGIIMGPAVTLHMLFGALVGWGILSPLAKTKGWAPGPVDDWETGSKGWIVWVSLAIMLSDSVISLGALTVRTILPHGPQVIEGIRVSVTPSRWPTLFSHCRKSDGYTALTSATEPRPPTDPILCTDYPPPNLRRITTADLPEPDAPPHHLVSNRVVVISLVLTLIICVASIHITFSSLIPLPLTLLSVLLALLLSLMGVWALGITDLNPVSGLSKLTQLVFALVTPNSKNAIIINLIAGAVSESGALQAGDMMQDLKTGHLVGAAPKAQFYGQIIGSIVGAVISAAIYQLYTSVYTIPGGMFQVPTGYVWIFTARLVTGSGLPLMAWQFAVSFGGLFCITTIIRTVLSNYSSHGTTSPLTTWLLDLIPGGIAFAVGMYNVPSFTMARAIGGILGWWWKSWKGKEETPIIILASGLILGEGLLSIANLGLSALGVPHL
ncbi:MAG: hypothetical protein M1834_000848 [Cirrosporium novae-zelandiae]|nr:MAG: hypothetical protein M1834_000848 [Cirrosporium novae-zelandiae]